MWKTAFTYDGIGRLRERREYSYPGGDTNSESLDSTTDYIYDGLRVIQERSSGLPTVSYTLGGDLSGTMEGAGGIGGLLARSHGYSTGNWTVHNFYHADGNGNVTYLVNGSQALAASYRYDAYGNLLASSGTYASVNTYRFSSKMVHDASGLYYYGLRWYAPNLQRWLNRDPIGEAGDINLFQFVQNAPVDGMDAFGLFTIKGVTVAVDECEIVIVYGHQDPTKPWQFEFPKGKPAAGGLVACWPGRSNNQIPKENQIPAPGHDNPVVWWEGTSDKAKQERILNEWPLGVDDLSKTIENAKKKAQEMVNKGHCKQVTIKFHRNGSSKGIPDLPKDILISTKK